MKELSVLCDGFPGMNVFMQMKLQKKSSLMALFLCVEGRIQLRWALEKS